MKVLMVVGSCRNNSYNQMVADYIVNKYKKKVAFKQADLSGLPVYCEDIENILIPSVSKLREDVNWADGVVILTPEHNFSMSVLIKNFLDWCSRVENVLVEKPVMITGATIGNFGTVMAQSHVRQALLSPGIRAYAIPGTEVYITSVHDRVERGELLEENAESLDKAFNNFIDYLENNKK